MFFGLFLCFVTLLCILHIKKRRRLPKGPPSIPIFGSIDLFTKGNLLKAIFNEEYYTKYNDFCTFFLGPRKVLVVINDFKICKELFNKEEYSGKKLIHLLDIAVSIIITYEIQEDQILGGIRMLEEIKEELLEF